MYAAQLQALVAGGQTRAELIETPFGPAEVQVPIDPTMPESVVAAMVAEQIGKLMSKNLTEQQGGGKRSPMCSCFAPFLAGVTRSR
jgi:hypothetical protein